MLNYHKMYFRSENCHFRLAIAAAIVGLWSVPTTCVFADASNGAYSAPNFDSPLFERDALSLERADRATVVAALTAIARNFPSERRVDTDVKEKALALALRLAPLDRGARSAHASLASGEAGDDAKPVPMDSVMTYTTGAEIFAALGPLGRRLWQQRLQPDDEILGPLLMELALTVLNDSEWQDNEVQKIAFEYRQLCDAINPGQRWDLVVDLQSIAGDGASQLASRLRALPSELPKVPLPESVVPPHPSTSLDPSSSKSV